MHINPRRKIRVSLRRREIGRVLRERERERQRERENIEEEYQGRGRESIEGDIKKVEKRENLFLHFDL